MHNNTDKDVEISKLEDFFKWLFKRAPFWTVNVAKKIYAFGKKTHKKIKASRQRRTEDKKGQIDKEPKTKGALAKAWNFAKRKLVVSRDHLTREQGVASTSHSRNSGEKPLMARSNSAEKGGTPDGKPRLSAMMNRANIQAKLHNDSLRGQGLARNPLAKGAPLPTR